VSQADNHRRWTDATRGVYEVWYLTWNHPDTGQGFWLRFITESPTAGPMRAELWFARFDPKDPTKTFGVHQRLAFGGASALPFEVRIAGAHLGHDHSFGELVGAGHDIRWDLVWEPGHDTLRQLPDLMYRKDTSGSATRFLSPNVRVPLSGTVLVDGEELAFDHVIAGQTHVWGRKHPYSWMWGRCAGFAGSDAVIEVLSTRLQRHGVMLPPMTILTLREGGEEYRLNQFRHVALNRGTWETGRARFSAWSPTVKIVGELDARPEQLVDAPYLDPDGTELWCANTEIGDARVTVYKRSGVVWREHKTLVGRGTAHFETGGRTRSLAVERVHTLA